MSPFVDVAVIPVPSDDLDSYREVAAAAGELWMDHGALDYFEGVAEVLEEDGPARALADLVGSQDGESTVLATIRFESAEHRNEVAAAVHADPAYKELFDEGMPFDPDRMATANFDQLVSYGNDAEAGNST